LKKVIRKEDKEFGDVFDNKLLNVNLRKKDEVGKFLRCFDKINHLNCIEDQVLSTFSKQN
jgi:hypothetical protein